MKILISNIRSYASNILKVLNDRNIKVTKDLDSLMEFGIKIGGEEKIVFSMRPSNQGTLAHTASYTTKEGGIPIELRLNTRLYYSQVIVKSQDHIEGYGVFNIDRFNNLAQSKKLREPEIALVKQELEALSLLKNHKDN